MAVEETLQEEQNLVFHSREVKAASVEWFQQQVYVVTGVADYTRYVNKSQTANGAASSPLQFRRNNR